MMKTMTIMIKRVFLIHFIKIAKKAVEKLGALHTETFLDEENGRTHVTYTLTKEHWK